MKTLTVSIENDLAEKAIIAVLDALKLDYEVNERNEFVDETEQIKANPYLADKLNQGKKDMENGKGTHVTMEDLWK